MQKQSDTNPAMESSGACVPGGTARADRPLFGYLAGTPAGDVQILGDIIYGTICPMPVLTGEEGPATCRYCPSELRQTGGTIL